jgi:ketosteroid isomerase-like protein
MFPSFLRLSLSVFLFIATSIAQNTPDEVPLLMQLDRDFDKATAKKGVNGWVAYFAPNGSMISDTSKPTTGADEIRKVMGPAFQDSSFSLRWHPVKAEMMMPGVLGYTVGRWERLRKNKEGKMMKSTGSYTSVWKKQPDGSWKIVLDTGNPDGPPQEIK